ncbi:MAG: hypothetical protein RIR39_1555 [Pseudomonadota bacterium]|jgi:hypothetical protein
MSNKIIKLSKPIIEGDIEHTELTLREPTIDDISKIGYPFLLIETDNGTAVQVQVNIILKYASTLGGVPPSCIKTLKISDLSNIQAAVMSFFGDEAETSQT